MQKLDALDQALPDQRAGTVVGQERLSLLSEFFGARATNPLSRHTPLEKAADTSIMAERLSKSDLLCSARPAPVPDYDYYGNFGSLISMGTVFGAGRILVPKVREGYAINESRGIGVGQAFVVAGLVQGIGDGIMLCNAQSAPERRKYSVALGLDAGMIIGGFGLTSQFCRSRIPLLTTAVGVYSIAIRFCMDGSSR